jgi:polysaccharide deacetylase family protein (PEP-CTERM system associated)
MDDDVTIDQPSILTIDVEDWFHILDLPATPPIQAWDALPSRVESSFLRLLDVVGDARTTCFFLGWVADRFPHLVREAVARGHEIAAHGYAHRLVFDMGRSAFLEDAVRARKVLEDISGRPIAGYRSAGFSVRADTTWFFDALVEAGYRYDSSVFPAARGHGGMAGGPREPHVVDRNGARLVELPVTVTPIAGRPLCFFGGGYLRLYPYPLVWRMAERVLAERRPVIFYVHPREIDPSHPRLPMSLARRFKSYVNLKSTAPKLQRIVQDFPLVTAGEYATRTLDEYVARLAADAPIDAAA